MIRVASSSDIKVIYDMWKEYFAHDDFGSIDYFFNNTLAVNNLYVLVENDVIISSLYLNSRTVMINNCKYNAGFISGVLTHKDYRNKGYMDKLFRFIFDSKLYDVYLLQAYNPKIYSKYGFKHLYTYKKYSFNDVELSDSYSDEFDIDDLLNVYNEAMNQVNGYVIRDQRYYKNMIKELEVMNSKILYSGVDKSYVVIDADNNVSELMLSDANNVTHLFEVGNSDIVVNVNSMIDIQGASYQLVHDVLIKSDILDLDSLENLYMNEYY